MSGRPTQGRPRGDGLMRPKRKIVAERQCEPRPEPEPIRPRRKHTEHFHEAPKPAQ